MDIDPRLADLEALIAAFEGQTAQQREAIQAMDDENIRLADSHAAALRTEARQMTQTRKGVSTYGRSDLIGSESQFDKKQ